MRQTAVRRALTVQVYATVLEIRTASVHEDTCSCQSRASINSYGQSVCPGGWGISSSRQLPAQIGLDRSASVQLAQQL
jgi:hypothetical protein